MEPDTPCERCIQLQQEFELYEQLVAAEDARRQALQEILRLQEARIAELERRLRARPKRSR